MSVWIYKGEESELIAPEFLDAQLSAGWSVTKTEEVVSIDDLSALEKST